MYRVYSVTVVEWYEYWQYVLSVVCEVCTWVLIVCVVQGFPTFTINGAIILKNGCVQLQKPIKYAKAYNRQALQEVVSCFSYTV